MNLQYNQFQNSELFVMGIMTLTDNKTNFVMAVGKSSGSKLASLVSIR